MWTVVDEMKFTRAELVAFHGAVVDDLIDDRVRLLFVGINPGLWTAAVNAHFARRGNRFWPALYAAGITPRLMDVSDGMSEADRELVLGLGIGITNIVPTASARAEELSLDELRAGAAGARGNGAAVEAERRCRARSHRVPASVRRAEGQPRAASMIGSAARSCGSCPTRAASTPTRPSTAWRRRIGVRGSSSRLTRRDSLMSSHVRRECGCSRERNRRSVARRRLRDHRTTRAGSDRSCVGRAERRHRCRADRPHRLPRQIAPSGSVVYCVVRPQRERWLFIPW